MGTYRFRLAKILKLRERAEQESAHALGRATGALTKALRWLDELAARRAEVMAGRAELQRGRIEPVLLGRNRYQLIVLDRAIVETQGRLPQLERDVAAARAELAERSKARRLLEKLDERRRGEHEQEERRREQRELDSLPRTRDGMTIAIQGPDSHPTGQGALP